MTDSWTDPAPPAPPAPPLQAPVDDRPTWASVVNRLIPNAAFAISMALIGGFFWAYWLAWKSADQEEINLMTGAMVAAFAGAWGYWLGSSRGSAMKDQAMAWMSRRQP